MKTHVTINGKKILLNTGITVRTDKDTTFFSNSEQDYNNLLLALDGLSFTPAEPEPINLKEWRENIREDDEYLILDEEGNVDERDWHSDKDEIYKRSIGNMFPDTDYGIKLLQAYRAKLIEDNK